MKKYLNMFVCAACVVALLSCEKEQEAPEAVEDGIVPPGYTLETLRGESEQTKTTIDNGVTLWAAADQIKVICSDNSVSNFTIRDGVGTNTGDFQGLVPEGKTAVYAVYPAANYSSVSGSTVKVNIPAEQTGVFGAGNLAVAKVDAYRHMAFKNVNAFISFTIPAEITKVVISSVSGADLSGTLSVACSGDAPAAGSLEDGASSVTTTFPDANGGTYYISVAPGVNHPKGLLLTYYKGEEVSGTYYLNKNITTAANINITMGTVEAEGNYYVTVSGAGSKNGMSWENAFSAEQMWKKLHLAGTDEATDAAKLAAIDGATFHMASGTYDFGADPSLSFSEAEPVTLTFKGGYNASTGVQDLEAYTTDITGTGSHSCLRLSGKLNITLDGLRFVNGKVSGDPDGALYCSGGDLDLTMTDCVVSGNTSTGSNGAGLALNSVGSLDATRVIFSGNSGKVAPGLLCIDTDMTLTDCTFRGNSATSWCGAVRVRKNNPTAIFTRCTFDGNSSTGDSGCFVHSEGTVTIDGCTFTNNTCTGNGGAFTTTGVVTSVIKGATTFSGNEARLGGAIFTGGTNASKETAMTISEDCVFSENHATGWAGAIHFKSLGSLNVTDCTFSGNYSDGDSGAFNSDNANVTFTFTRVTFSGNHADSDNGGVMWISDGTYSFTNCQFLNNYSSGNGGAIFSEKSGDVSITDCTFQGNYTTCRQNVNDGKNGGALYVTGAPALKIRSSHFNDNYAGIGGAIFTNRKDSSYPTIFLNGCSFSGNYVQYRYGTAINIDNASYFCMNNCSFANNHYVNLTSGGDGLKASWVAIDGIHNCSVISNCSLIGRTWRYNNGLENSLTNNALIGLWDATKTYLINDLIILDSNGNTLSPLRGSSEDPKQQVVAHYTHYSKDNINIDWSGDNNLKGYWKEHTRYGNSDAVWDEDCWKWDGYYEKNGSAINNFDKISKSAFTGYLNEECPAFVTWLGNDIGKDQLGNDRGSDEWFPGAYQAQPGVKPVLLQAITWNIRSSEMGDTGDRAWSARRGGMAAFINDRQPQIICMQECEADQRTYLTGNCSGYSAIYDNTSLNWWQQISGAERSNEVILYKTSDISVQSSGTFWLTSGAPTTPTKSSTQNSYRSCTWIKCTYRGQKMLVLDTHLSYRTKSNATPGSADVIALREQEMGVIKTWIDGHYNPSSDGWLLFMGDMNTSQHEAIFDEWKDGTYGYFSRDKCPGASTGRTYNDWDWENGNVATIDLQFYKGFPAVKSYTIPTDTYSDVDYLSDHWPVVVEYRMN